MQTRLEEKALHGRYPARIKEADDDMKATNQWLTSYGIKAETEGIIVSKDQALPTKTYHHHIINKYEETIDHVVSSCKEIAKKIQNKIHNTGTTMWQPMYTGRSLKNTKRAQ